MKWQNTGSAPCYRPYRVAYRLSNDDGDTTTIVGLETVEKWMPGEIELFSEDFFEQPADLPPGPINDVAETIHLPEDLPSGTFTPSIAIVGRVIKNPVVQLGIEGRDKDGWYPPRSPGFEPQALSCQLLDRVDSLCYVRHASEWARSVGQTADTCETKLTSRIQTVCSQFAASLAAAMCPEIPSHPWRAF